MADLTGAPAQTIHRLLEVDFSSKSHAFKRREDNPLTCDVLIIDEMSMVDTLLMDSLLKAIRPRTRLIMSVTQPAPVGWALEISCATLFPAEGFRRWN